MHFLLTEPFHILLQQLVITDWYPVLEVEMNLNKAHKETDGFSHAVIIKASLHSILKNKFCAHGLALSHLKNHSV